MDVEEGGRLGDVAQLVQLLKIETNTGSGFLAVAQRGEETQSVQFIAPRQSVCIKNFFYWPHIAVRCKKNCHPKIRLQRRLEPNADCVTVSIITR